VLGETKYLIDQFILTSSASSTRRTGSVAAPYQSLYHRTSFVAKPSSREILCNINPFM
jgi:hypothetical protein